MRKYQFLLYEVVFNFFAKLKSIISHLLCNLMMQGVANIEHDFPAIANDVKLPSFVPKEKIFSSVFRIASADLQLWTHYDVSRTIFQSLHSMFVIHKESHSCSDKMANRHLFIPM